MELEKVKDSTCIKCISLELKIDYLYQVILKRSTWFRIFFKQTKIYK